MSLEASEFILNEDGSIYHLNLLPKQLAQTVITVGDPERVSQITQHFDSVDFSTQKREFHTQTGFYRGKRISVISTGIGTDNIDIVLNELDALVNIDFEKKKIKDKLSSLDIIRIGTTGAIQEDIKVGSFLMSQWAIGFDGLLHFYDSTKILHPEISEEFVKQTGWSSQKTLPYVVEGNEELMKKMDSHKIIKGFTATNVGFYGPQGRSLRLKLQDADMNKKITSFKHKNKKITNLEMETSGIYGLSKLLGHRAVSMNLVLANRINRTFIQNPHTGMDNLITYCLNKIAE